MRGVIDLGIIPPPHGNHLHHHAIDLAPTILAATQSQTPATMQGRDMSPLYLSSKAAESLSLPWRTEFFADCCLPVVVRGRG